MARFDAHLPSPDSRRARRLPLRALSPRAEHGQANVHLAIMAALQEQHGDKLDIHLASFDSLRKRCPSSVTFHVVVGMALTQMHSMDKNQGKTISSTASSMR
jgi:hypothetical protein